MPTPPTPGLPDTGRIILTRRLKVRERTAIVINYPSHEANDIRKLAQSITLKAGAKPPLSLLARRALHVYRTMFPRIAESEIAAMNALTTPVPRPAKVRRRFDPKATP